MKLKTKRLLAAALAISLTANISLAAFAVNYNLIDGNGDVYISDEDGEITSYVANKYGDDTFESEHNHDTTINVTSNGETTDHSVNISGDVTDATINIEKTVFNVTDDKDAAINIADDSKVGDLTLSNVEINVNAKNTSGIEIGTDAEVNMTLEGENEINLNAGTTSGIKTGEGSDVTITVDGTTNITANYADEDNPTGISNEDDDGNMTVGIVVGGGVSDGADDGDGAELTITGTENENDELNISGTSTGIMVHGNSSLTIGDADEADSGEANNTVKVNISGATRTYDGDEHDGSAEGKDKDGFAFYTSSGKGIMSWGDLTITEGATVNVDDSDQIGINVKGGNLTIDGGAKVSVTNISDDYEHVYQTWDEENQKWKGSNLATLYRTYAGIYVETGSNVLISGKDTEVNVGGTSTTDNEGNVTWTTSQGQGIDVEGGENTWFEVSDGATVNVSHAQNDGISVGANKIMLITNNGTVNISNTGAGLYLNPNSILYVKTLDSDGNSIGTAELNITDIAGNGISAENASIEIGGEGAVITINNVGNAGVDLSGSGNTSSKYLKVYKYGELNITKASYVGILAGGDGASTTSNNKTIEILSDAVVTITESGENSVILWGADNSLTVDDATLDVNSNITVYSDVEPSTITVNNGAKVVAKAIRNYNGGNYYFYITGGTVKVGPVTDERVDPETVLDITDSTSLNINSKLWPTSGENNGNESLTNFRLNAVELQTFQDENQGDLTDDKFFAQYGYIITTDNKLIFQTYGYTAEDGYIDYNSTDDGTEWYVVDLTKYTEEELEDLWVWTPAVVLSYYVLDEGKTLNDAVPYDESTPWEPEGDRNNILPFVEEDVDGDGVVEYYQVDVNGNKVTVTDEEGNEQYVMVKLADADATYVLYKDGKFYQVQINSDTGEYTIGEEVNTGIATKATSDHDVIIRGMFLDFGNFKTNKEYETYEATSDKAKTTAFADAQKAYPGYTFWVYNPFDDENVISLDTIRVTEGEDGQYYQVDENGKVLSDEAIELNAENSYVLYVNEKYFKVDSIDEDGKIVLATDKNGNRIEMVNGEWVEFTSMGRIRSKSQVTDETEENYKNGFALKDPKKPTPDEEEPDPTPQEPTTEEPDEPREPVDHEHPHPEIPVDPVVPVTPETPAQPGETPAETPADPEAPAEPATPASSTPKTGDDSNVAIYLVMAALSGAALIGLGVTGKKKNEKV